MKSSFKRTNLFIFLNLTSRASNDRYKVIKKSGKKLIKYLEVRKWDILKNFENRKRPTTGRMKMAKRRKEIFRNLEKMGKRISKITETTIRGK
jgi:hypothetical protein